MASVAATVVATMQTATSVVTGRILRRIPLTRGIAIYPAGRDEHPTPAPLGELDRLDRIEVYYGYSAHSPSLRM